MINYTININRKYKRVVDKISNKKDPELLGIFFVKGY